MQPRFWPIAVSLTLLTLPAATGCGGIESATVTDGGIDGPGPGTDAGADATNDSPSDQDVGNDGSDGGNTDAAAGYSALNDTSKWTTFDMATVNGGAKGFTGAAFDGRYVYFVPNNSGSIDGLAGRYDTMAAFTTGTSWATFDMTTLNSGAKGFVGAAFDGRYVYFVPFGDGLSGSFDGLVGRCDTMATFTSGSSWTIFDTTTVNAGAKGFVGAAFDGRYVYFVPFGNGTSTDGLVGRYDTMATFTSGSSWTTFDMTTVNAGAKGFQGAVFDGRYLYLVPNYNGSTDGLVGRYDTMATFTSGSSWTTFDMTTVNAQAKGFQGAAFDGRYVYFVPSYNGSIDGLVARYDTMAAFTAGGSWATFDMTTVNAGAKGFLGAAFDGRYVYFVPYSTGPFDGLVARYDTMAAFTTGTSWTTFDMTTVNAGAKGFAGAAFDGRFLYFVPADQGIVARFDAKTPPALPPGYAHGSFL
jgi:hypothetical protein